MPWINRPAIDSDRVVEAAMLLEFLAALVAMRAQRLQSPSPELHWIVMVWLDVIGNACAVILPSRKHHSQSGCARS
jgi:hypothetical protein